MPFTRKLPSILFTRIRHWLCCMSQVKSSHYYLYSVFNNANCVKAALHQLDIKLGGFTSALQYLDGEIVCRNSVILLWPDIISNLNLGCSRFRLCKGLIWFMMSAHYWWNSWNGLNWNVLRPWSLYILLFTFFPLRICLVRHSICIGMLGLL